MKKLLLLSAALLQLGSFGQTLPNGTFENWTSIPYEEPNLWTTSNPRDVPKTGLASVTKVTGFSGFGLRIQNNVVGADTSESYIINTNNPCADPPQWTGGVPYSQQPTAISGKYRYNLLGNDTALLIVIFRKNGLHIGDNYILIRGTGSQPTFTSFTFSVNCAGVPDSIIIAAAPSNKKSNTVSNNGSYIELDNLAFVGATQPIPNGDFENWTSRAFDITSGWASWGSGFTKTTSSFAGSYAVRLETMSDQCNGVNSSGITTGYVSSNSAPRGGRPYVKTSDTLCGYYKYTSIGNDTASISVNLSKNGINIGGNSKKLIASANYVYFQLPFSVGTTPDTMRIDAQSSHWPTLSGNSGSVLSVDNLFLKSQPTGIFENKAENLKVISFPNPVKDILYIESEKGLAAPKLNVYDAFGRNVKSTYISGITSFLQIDIADLSYGMYYYEIKAENGSRVLNKFVKE